MGTPKPSYHGLLLPQDRACWAPLHGPRTERIPQLSQRPITARAQEPSAGDLRSDLGSLALPRELGPTGQAGTITRRHFISRRRWAVFWRQATVSGSDKKHLNPIMD